MKKLINIYVAILITGTCIASDYSPLQVNYCLGFNCDWYADDIRIDSVKTLSDSSFIFPNKAIITLDNSCYFPYSSLLGSKIYTKNDSIIFFNIDNEPIIIKSSNPLNQEWTTYNNANILIKARIEECSQASILGNTDSIKTIGFSVYDNNLNPFSSPINSLKIKLSKNYGIIQSINFFALTSNSIIANTSEMNKEYVFDVYEIIPDPENISWEELYDINVGDEIHAIETNYVFNGSSLTSKNDSTFIIYKYLEKTVNTGSIEFKIDRLRKIALKNDISSSTTYIHDTINSTVTKLSYLDTKAGELIFDNYECFSLYNTSCLNQKGKGHKSFADNIYNTDGYTCWRTSINDGCFPNYEYYKGLGGPYLSCDNLYGGSRSNYYPVYFKKGNQTSGLPIVITAFQECKADEIGSIFPNPAKDKISVKSNEAVSIEIKDQQGKTLKQVELKDANTEISITDLNPGVYIYKITNSKLEFSSGKLIVE